MRRLLNATVLAFVLAAGLTPAFAQAPPAVPGLPDTERRTTYNLTASTCTCAVGFQLYGDGTDYANWITVWVNGVQIQQAGNWTVTSPTGPLATIPRPITNAVLTFAAPQTGTVQIVGARRPRRVSQFTEGRGVSARDFNQALTDIVAQNRETWDRVARTVQAPPGETLSVLSPMAQRAGQGACFDSGGNLISCVSVPGSTFSAGSGIAFSGTNPTSISADIAAGNGITFSGSHPVTISASSQTYVLPRDFGVNCDGATDYAVQLQEMLTASAGKVIYIPPGPACVTGTTLNVPANTTIIGGGREVSVLKGVGAANPILSATNVSNISISHLWLQGSDSATSWAASNIGAIRILQNAGAVAAGQNFSFQNVKFSGFNTNYWVLLSTFGSSYSLSNVTFSNNLLVSASDDIPTDPVNANNSNTAFVIYTAAGGNGRVENTVIHDNLIDANSLCVAINLFSHHYKYRVSDNAILRPGATSTSHCTNGLGATNAYGILVYDVNSDGNPPSRGIISRNLISTPYSAGIYVAGDGDPSHTAIAYNDYRLLISENLIDGQVTDDDSALPRAAIAVNNASNVDIIGNKAYGGFGGFAATAQFAGVVNISGNQCSTGYSSIISKTSCVRIAAAPGTSNTARIVVKGNFLETLVAGSSGGNVIRGDSSSTAQFYAVEISDNTINAGWTGLNFASQYVSKSLALKNNAFGGPSYNFMAILGTTGAPAVIMNNVFDGSGGGNGYGLDVHGSVIHMANNKFVNRASGSNPMFRADGSCGTIIGTQFNNVTQSLQVYPGSLGTTNPSSCTLNYLDQVQNLTPGELGGSGNKYVVDHWSHVDTAPSTTHVEQRMLTGS